MNKHLTQRATTASLALSIAPLALTGITTIIGLILSSSIVSATNDSVVDQVNITVPVSCTMTGTGMNTHNAEIANGTYTPNIGTTTLHAFCNDNEGFAIYATGYTGNTIGETSSNKLVGTNASSNSTIESGIATSAGNPDISNWAMKLTATGDSGDITGTNAFTIDSAPNVALPSEAEPGATSASFSDYHMVPNEYVKVAHKNSNTDMTASTGGVKLTTTYAAYISKTQPADTYSGQVIYTLVHPQDETPASPQASTPGKITYHANSSKALGTMGEQDKDDAGNDLTDGADVTLLASNFSRDGYGFAGWTNRYDYMTSIDQNLKFYGPQETIQAPTGTTENGLSLYAVWIPSNGALQDQSKVVELCGTGSNSLIQAPTDGMANLSSVAALTDLRDNQTYAIAKLADGRCWMIENLRLQNTAAHNTDGVLSQGYDPSFIGLAESETDSFNGTTTTTANSLYSIDGSTEKTISGDNKGNRFPRYNNLNTPTGPNSRPVDPSGNTFPDDGTTPGMYSYGNYYTWAAVVADTNNYTSGNYIATSICPAGWYVPTGGPSSEYDTLNASANAGAVDTSIGLRRYPVNLLYSGYFNYSSAFGRGDYGQYWSSTVSDANRAIHLRFDHSSTSSGNQMARKNQGKTIRCIARQSY